MSAKDSGGEHYLVEHLRERFAEDARLGELGLEVYLVGRVLHVHGEVATNERRDMVGVIAAELEPRCEIRNEVRVTEVRHAPEREVMQ